MWGTRKIKGKLPCSERRLNVMEGECALTELQFCKKCSPSFSRHLFWGKFANFVYIACSEK